MLILNWELMSIQLYCVALLLSFCTTLTSQAQTTPSATGADVGWITEMKVAGRKFYNKAGTQHDLFQLLRDDYGMNTIRLRVWVNPPGGYQGAAD